MIVKSVFWNIASSTPDVYVPIERTPGWIYVLVAIGVAIAVVGAGILISKKMK